MTMSNLQYKLEDKAIFSDVPSLDMDGVFHIIERKGGVVCKFSGCWCKEKAMAFSSSFKECIKKNYQFKKWGVINDIDDWRQVSDEAIEILEDLISWAEEHGQMANVYICKGDRDFDIFSIMYAKESTSKIHYRTSPSFDSGIVWLNRLGLNLMSEQVLIHP